MHRFGFVLLLLVWMTSCNNDKKEAGDKDGNTGIANSPDRVSTAPLPYTLSDSDLLRNRDTASVRMEIPQSVLPDSLRRRIFSAEGKIKYTPLARFIAATSHNYFVVKASSGNKKAALLLVYGKEGGFEGSLPFLIPDSDPSTSQVSIIDKSFSISRNISRRQVNDISAEGKDVYVYTPETKQFVPILTEPLDDSKLELINPIDTLRKTQKFTGDYAKDKRNIVSIRDGRSPNQLMAFVHIENEENGCKGELKGELLMTSASSAIFRQGGDPCVMQFRFTGSTVELQEEEGCGNHRGLDCAFAGRFPKKKEIKPATTKKRKK